MSSSSSDPAEFAAWIRPLATRPLDRESQLSAVGATRMASRHPETEIAVRPGRLREGETGPHVFRQVENHSRDVSRIPLIESVFPSGDHVTM